MSKTTHGYWNPLLQTHASQWQAIEGMAEELTLSIDHETGEYTRLTRFSAGADTSQFGVKIIHTLKKFSLSVVVFMIKPVTCG